MNGLNDNYLVALFLSNGISLLILFCAIKYQRIARLLFSLLFFAASGVNWHTLLNYPQVYLDYAYTSFLPLYKSFIIGWFSKHIVTIISTIALGQLCIAVAMCLRGWIFTLGTIGGLLFSIGIIPLGIGSAFPMPILMAVAFYLLLYKGAINYLWKSNKTTLFSSAKIN